jgi:hypothetical protein
MKRVSEIFHAPPLRRDEPPAFARRQGLPNCLKDCEQLAAECCDNEATYFYQFILLKCEAQDAPPSSAASGNWAQLPWANRLVATPAAHKRFAKKIKT